jgi:hypothetical protein
MMSLVGGVQNQPTVVLSHVTRFRISFHKKKLHFTKNVEWWHGSAKKIPTHMTTDLIILLFYSLKGLPTKGSNN